jgi:hypothetical protein
LDYFKFFKQKKWYIRSAKKLNVKSMLKGILTISGQPGLYKVISENKNSVIVESIATGKKYPAFSSSKMSALEDISVYTMEEDVPLKDVLKKIFEKENGKEAISHKASANELKEYFGSILPDYDRDQVYVSDIKKIIRWYNLLSEKGLVQFEEEKGEETTEENK